MSEKEEDLILGGEENSETESIVDWFEERADVRSDIDTAIYVYNFLEELDVQGADVLRWNLKRKLTKTKKHCLQIICKSIEDLMIEKDDETEDD